MIKGVNHLTGHVREYHAALRTQLNERQLKALGRMLDALPQGFVGGVNEQEIRAPRSHQSRDRSARPGGSVSKGYLVSLGGGRSARYELPEDVCVATGR